MSNLKSESLISLSDWNIQSISISVWSVIDQFLWQLQSLLKNNSRQFNIRINHNTSSNVYIKLFNDQSSLSIIDQRSVVNDISLKFNTFAPCSATVLNKNFNVNLKK